MDLSQLTQFLDAPTDEPMLAGLHVLKFLKNNRGKRLFFSSSPSLTLKGFSHSDWGAFQDTRRSTIGFCFFHGTPLISWKSKKEVCGIKIFIKSWIQKHLYKLLYLLQDFLITHITPIILYCIINLHYIYSC